MAMGSDRHIYEDAADVLPADLVPDDIETTDFVPLQQGQAHLDPHPNGIEGRVSDIRQRFDSKRFILEREGNTIRIRSKDHPISHIAPYVYELNEDGSGIESHSEPLPPDVSKLTSETPVRDLFRN